LFHRIFAEIQRVSDDANRLSIAIIEHEGHAIQLGQFGEGIADQRSLFFAGRGGVRLRLGFIGQKCGGIQGFVAAPATQMS
jgi:hypothetical protein